jgi:hypothetical protein
MLKRAFSTAITKKTWSHSDMVTEVEEFKGSCRGEYVDQQDLEFVATTSMCTTPSRRIGDAGVKLHIETLN